MPIAKLVVYAPFATLLIWGAVSDLRCRRIPNVVTLGLVLLGLAQSFTSLALLSPRESISGVGVGFGLPLLIYLMGGLGAADVKLFAGIGAWVGVVLVLRIFAAAAVVGLVVVLIQAAWQGKLKALFVNSAVLLLTLMHIRRLGAEEVIKSGKDFRSIDKPMPYGVIVLIATTVVLVNAGVVRVI